MPEMGDLISFNAQADTFNDFQEAKPEATNFDSVLNLYNQQPSMQQQHP
jgi:hypothetical protein